MTKAGGCRGAGEVEERITTGFAPRKPISQAPNVPAAVARSIFIRLALIAVLLLSNAARSADRVHHADQRRGRLSWAKILLESAAHSAHYLPVRPKGNCCRDPMISGITQNAQAHRAQTGRCRWACRWPSTHEGVLLDNITTPRSTAAADKP